jgi:arginase
MGERIPLDEAVRADTVVEPELPPKAAPTARMAVLCREIAAAVAADPRPLVVAGDCVAAIGVLAGLRRKGIDPRLVWLDAHGDFHTWETTSSGFVGGMPLAMLTGRGEQTVVDGAGLEPPADERVVLVGARQLDPGEDGAVAASGIRRVPVRDVWVPAGPFMVHLDVDVVDPGDMPAVSYPVPGGPSLAEVAAALESLAGGGPAAFSLSSWSPGLPGAPESAAAALGLAAAFEAGAQAP